MLHGVLGSDALCVVISQHHAEQIVSFSRYQVTVFICLKVSPRLAFYVSYSRENFLKVFFFFYRVFESKLFQIGVEILSAKYLYKQLKLFRTI